MDVGTIFTNEKLRRFGTLARNGYVKTSRLTNRRIRQAREAELLANYADSKFELQMKARYGCEKAACANSQLSLL